MYIADAQILQENLRCIKYPIFGHACNMNTKEAEDVRIKKIMATVIGCMMVGGYLYTTEGILDPNENDASILPIGQLQERVRENTVFEQTIHYIGCNEDETIREKAATNVVGMTREEVAQLYRDWKIDSFTPQTVVLKLAVNGVCKEHRKAQFVGVHEGKVAVYYGTPSKKAIVKEVTEIDISTLIPQVRDELQKGITFRTEEERLRIMEGLQAR